MESFINYIKSLEDRIIELEENRNIVIDIKDIKKSIYLGYYPYWRNDIDISEYGYLTLCFLNIYGDGRLDWERIDEINVEHNYKGISIGGWTDREKIKKILSTHRDIVIKNLVKETNDRGLKYISYDIEYPDTNEWIKDILKRTKEEIERNGFNIKLSVAIGCWKGHIELYKDCNEYLDFVEIMCYDLGEKNIIEYVDSSIKNCNEIGIPNSKIMMGISYDKNGDNNESIKYKKEIQHNLNLMGIMFWH